MKSLGLIAAALATESAIHKNFPKSGTTTLIISNKKMEGMIKIVKFLGKSGVFIKGENKTFKNKAKQQKSGLHSRLFVRMNASLLGTLQSRKCVMRVEEGRKVREDQHV